MNDKKMTYEELEAMVKNLQNDLEKLNNKIEENYQVINELDNKVREQAETISSQVEMIQTQKKEIKTQKDEIQRQKGKIQNLYNTIQVYRKRIFGTKSEKSKVLNKILEHDLFNEIEVIEALESEIPEEYNNEPKKKKIKDAKERKARTNKLKESMDQLPAVEVEVKCDEDVCPYCGSALASNGTSTTERLIYVSGYYRKVVVKLQKKICTNINCSYQGQYQTRAKYDELYSGTYGTSSLVSGVLHNKFILGMPIYRQVQEMNRIGIDITRQTLNPWLFKACNALISIYNKIHEDIVKTDYLLCDETTAKVLSEKNDSGNTKKTYYWCVMDPIRKIVYYKWASREKENMNEALAGFKGVLGSDKYSGYKDLGDDMISQICNAHARRKLTEICGKDSFREKALKIYSEIYRIDDEILTSYTLPSDIVEQRKAKLLPLFDELKKLYEDENNKCKDPGKDRMSSDTPKGRAINYILNDFDKFTTFVNYPHVRMDSNIIESVGIRPITVGRKNYLFFDNPYGANASTVVYSILLTAKFQNIDTVAYLQYLLENYEEITPDKDLTNYMPYSKAMIEKFGVKK